MSKSQKPTARLYYLKLLEETKIETKWNLARCKMRHLKALFVKANGFLNSTGDGVEDEDGDLTIQEKIKKICPYYDTLSEIFSPSREATVREFDTMEELEEQMFDTNTNTNTDTDIAPFQEVSQIDASIVVDDTTLESEPKVKKRRANSSMEKLYALEEDRVALRREQLKHEQEKEKRYMELEEKKFSLEKEKQERYMALEEKKLSFEVEKIKLEKEKIRNDFLLKLVSGATVERARLSETPYFL
ncbi:hypothetical protein ACLKA7_014650 [Drosophila subpalustris]